MPATQFGTTPTHGDLKVDLHRGEVIEDRTGSRCKNGLPARYAKGRFLGKGGFAKCYEVLDMESKEVFAAKIVDKSSITKPRAHAKLRSEIAIHRSLSHEKVVRFYDYFEDSEHVYMILELCSNQALNDFMRKRPNKRFTEQETMFYLYELIMALKYLHKRRVIHRDLKLGNLFLDKDGHLKVGDFGLAAQLEHDGEKKRTICGTPNYIAPEILEGKHGHSYEVDIWSLGVILYTMLIGRPPFETSEVKTTYRRIRYNQYTWPENVHVSEQSKDLVAAILKTDPRSRASLDEIIAHPWFQSSSMPPPMPVTISSYSASPRPVGSSARSETPDHGQNFARIDSPAPGRCPLTDRSPSANVVQTPDAKVLLAEPAKTSTPLATNRGVSTPNSYTAGPGSVAGRPRSAQRGNDENMVPATNDAGAIPNANGKASSGSQAVFGAASIPQQTQSYTPQPTTQHGMPWATSHSHRPPSRDCSPMVASSSVPTKVVAHGYSSARAATRSPRPPLHSTARTPSYQNVAPAPAAVSTPKDSRSARLFGQPESGTGPLFTKTAGSSPSLRRPGSSAQRVPSHRPATAPCDSPRPATLGTQAAVTPILSSRGHHEPATAVAHTQDRHLKKERSSSSIGGEPATPATAIVTADYRKAPDSIRGLLSCRSSQGIDSPAEANFAACLAGEASASGGIQVAVSPTDMPELWVTKWVDYSSKYGVGYTLSDGSMGVYFNDSTKILLSPDGTCFDYITRRTQDKPEVRTKHTFEDFPEDLKKKVTLLRHFRNYMQTDNLAKKDGASVGESGLQPTAQSNAQKAAAATAQAYDAGQAPYVKKWTRNKHAIMFQLSNKIVQVVFFDKTEAVLSSKSHMVTYIDKKGQVCSYPLSNVLDVPSPELAKRLRYTKDILVNLLGGRASDLGGA